MGAPTKAGRGSGEDGSGVIRGPAPETSHSGFTQVLITKQNLLFKVKSPPKFLEMNKTFQVLAGGPPLSGDRHYRGTTMIGSCDRASRNLLQRFFFIFFSNVQNSSINTSASVLFIAT